VHIELPEAMPVPKRQKGCKETVEYTLGTAPHVHTLHTKKTSTVAETLAKIRKERPGVAMEQIQVAGAAVDEDVQVEDWISRSRNHPFQVVVSRLVEVRIWRRGPERTMPARTSRTQEEFTQAAKGLVTTRKDAIVRRRGGEPSWEVRAGHTYELVETAQVTIKLYDTAGKPHEFKATGAIELGELVELVKTRFGLLKWEQVFIKRTDEQPFWAEDRGKYSLTMVYDQEADTRLQISVRFDATDRTYFTDEFIFDQTGDLDALV
jgi:hypothetical protein